MAEKKLDRRVVRTRRALRDALLALIIEQGYENIKIHDITNKADLRRATFYLHYKSVEELLLSALREIFDEFTAELDAKQLKQPFYIPTRQPHMLPIFEYVAENAELYTALLTGAPSAKVQKAIRDYLIEIKLKDLATIPMKALPAPPDVIAGYIASTETAMLVWWLENNMPYSPKKIARMVQNLIQEGIAPLRELA